LFPSYPRPTTQTSCRLALAREKQKDWLPFDLFFSSSKKYGVPAASVGGRVAVFGRERRLVCAERLGRMAKKVIWVASSTEMSKNYFFFYFF
jgi:hypothetical protein